MHAYHDHLDVCAQCREHPWSLCPTGAKLPAFPVGDVDDLARELVAAGDALSPAQETM